jgi:tetratricopeptide (TPR) repeat protein/tRNA A-37 threonylcarbamoyl transferase component Bud32
MTESESAQSDGDPRLDGAINDYLEAQARGQRIDPEQFLAMYPGIGEPLRQFLQDHRAVAQALAQPTEGEPLADHRRYEVYEVLNRGGMGVIWRCRDRVLGRELAVKTLRRRFQDRPEIVARFQEEAQIGSQLQHPGIPPVYDLDRLLDGQPFFTMKLIEGRNLAQLLAERKSPGDELPQFLGIFRQVCQTVAYAHSRNVLHRDLKPANIMVGAFGEVQVMDWGLGKVLSGPAEDAGPGVAISAQEALPAAEVETIRTRAADSATSADTVLGTYSYMAVEQAQRRGIDQRSDVFGLGAILCEILTGLPPYLGTTKEEVMRQAKAADLAVAFARLAACGADPDLVALTKACLAAEPDRRPAGAEAVAKAVTTYLNKVQEKLRQAELARTRLRWQLGLAAAVFLATLGAVVAWTLYKVERDAQDLAAEQQAKDRKTKFHDQLRRAEELFTDPAQWLAARAALEGAKRLAQGEDALLNLVRLKGEELDHREELEQGRLRMAQIKESNLDYPGTRKYFAAAFAKLGLEVEKGAVEDMARRVAASPLREELIQALDFWSLAATEGSKRNPAGKHFLRIAQAADNDAGRKEIRATILRDDQAQLERLAKLEEILTQRPTTLFLVAVTLTSRQNAIQLLRKAQRQARGDFWLNLALAERLSAFSDNAEERKEAVGFLRAALATRPRNALALTALGGLLALQNRNEEAEEALRAGVAADPQFALARAQLAVFLYFVGGSKQEIASLAHQAVADAPSLPYAHLAQGFVLFLQEGGYEKALAEIRRALDLQEDFADAHAFLGQLLALRGRIDEAEAASRKACALDPNSPGALQILAQVLSLRGKHHEALEACQNAVRLTPEWALLRVTLSDILTKQGKLAEAADAAREAIRLNPKLPAAHVKLGNALLQQEKLKEAEKAYQDALCCPQKNELDEAMARGGLGGVCALGLEFDQALKECEQALKVFPHYGEAYQVRATIHLLCKDVDAAKRDLEKAIELQPSLMLVHEMLGIVHLAKLDPNKAIESCKTALSYNPNSGFAYLLWGVCHLMQNQTEGFPKLRTGWHLMQKYGNGPVLKGAEQSSDFGNIILAVGIAFLDDGQPEEALTCFQRAQQVLGEQHPNRLAADKVTKLATILAQVKEDPGTPLPPKLKPASATEWLEFANVSQKFKHYAVAVRFFDEAFTMDGQLRLAHGYNRACAAVLAGCGQGWGVAKAPEADRSRYRQSALAWFGAELRLLDKQLNGNPTNAAAEIARTLQFWQGELALVPVRDSKALAQLPKAEMQAWQSFWTDVGALQQKALAAAGNEKKEK